MHVFLGLARALRLKRRVRRGERGIERKVNTRAVSQLGAGFRGEELVEGAVGEAASERVIGADCEELRGGALSDSVCGLCNVGAEAYARDAEFPQLVHGKGACANHDVHGGRNAVDESGDGGRASRAGHENAVCAGREIAGRTGKHLTSLLLFGSLTAEEHVSARIDEQVHARPVGCVARGGDPLRELLGGEGSILDVDADSASIDDHRNALRDAAFSLGEPALDVGGHRHTHRCCDAGNRGDGLITVEVVPVLRTEGPGNASACRRDGSGAGLFRDDRTRNIPGVAQRERVLGIVQRVKAFGKRINWLHDAISSVLLMHVPRKSDAAVNELVAVLPVRLKGVSSQYSDRYSGRMSRPPVRATRRPRADYVAGPVTKSLRWISLGVALAMSVVLLASYPSLPETIPIHFNVAGKADGWGPRSAILMLVGVFTVLASAITWLSFRPHLFNYPVEVTEENAQAVYREGERTLVWVCAAMTMAYVGMGLGSLIDIDPGLAIAVSMVGMLAAAVVGVVRSVRAAGGRR